MRLATSEGQVSKMLRPSPHYRQPFAQARELAAVKDRVHRLEQLLLTIAPEQAKLMLQGDLQHDSSLLQGGSGLNLTHIKQSDSDMEDEDDDEGEDGGEAEKAAFALESIAVAGRPPTVGTYLMCCSAVELTAIRHAVESGIRQRICESTDHKPGQITRRTTQKARARLPDVYAAGLDALALAGRRFLPESRLAESRR